MKKLFILALVVGLCGCRNRHYVEDEPYYEPDPAEEPAHTPVDELTRLVEQARNEIKNRRYDDARVTLWGAFRRDRWHPAANVVYQNLMIERGRFDIVWQEYMDLYHANKRRGDALWFHLRPLLLKKTPVTLERGPALTDEKREILKVALSEARKLADDGQRAEAQSAVMEAFNIDADNIVGHRIAQDLWPNDKLAALDKLYATMADDDPQSGDMLYLAARAKARTDNAAAIEMLRKGLILDLPGVWLRVGMAEMAYEKIRPVGGRPPVSSDALVQLRDRKGWEQLEAEFTRITLSVDPDNIGIFELQAHRTR